MKAGNWHRQGTGIELTELPGSLPALILRTISLWVSNSLREQGFTPAPANPIGFIVLFDVTDHPLG